MDKSAAYAMVLGSMLALPVPSLAAESVALYLKANGTDIRGDNTHTSLGRENSIECLGVFTSLKMPISLSTGGGTGRIEGGKFICKKAIDRASPVLINAMTDSARIDFVMKFFRPNPRGDGTTEQYYTITGKGARITGLEQALPDTYDPSTATLPPLELLTIDGPQLVEFTYTNGGITAPVEFPTAR